MHAQTCGSLKSSLKLLGNEIQIFITNWRKRDVGSNEEHNRFREIIEE